MPEPMPVSISDPLAVGGATTFADVLPARSGGYGRRDGLAALLQAERLEAARRKWEARPPSAKAGSPAFAAEVRAVFVL